MSRQDWEIPFETYTADAKCIGCWPDLAQSHFYVSNKQDIIERHIMLILALHKTPFPIIFFRKDMMLFLLTISWIGGLFLVLFSCGHRMLQDSWKHVAATIFIYVRYAVILATRYSLEPLWLNPMLCYHNVFVPYRAKRCGGRGCLFRECG